MTTSGENMIKMQTSATEIAFNALQNWSDLTKKAFPMKNAMKMESRTPVDLVKVLIPKKKQARRAADALGIPN